MTFEPNPRKLDVVGGEGKMGANVEAEQPADPFKAKGDEAEMLRGQLLEMAEERGELSEKAARTDELELQLENLIRAARAHPRLILWLKMMDDFRESIRETVGEDAEPEEQWELALAEVQEGLVPRARVDLVLFINRLAALSYWSCKLADRQVERGVAERVEFLRVHDPEP